tara:strand:- start:976 stop:2304 length:1329 start_codon:yes stop_codon:yes gene_type:complete
MLEQDSIANFISENVDQWHPPERYIIAFSGGLDSSVLLHNIVYLREKKPIIAVHVNHQISEYSEEWENFCRDVAKSYGIDIFVERVTIDRNSPDGIECEMRNKRYKAIKKNIQKGDYLMTGHHRDDQAETLLLRMIRGSSEEGLSGIKPMQVFHGGLLVRPLLDFSRKDLQLYAKQQELKWIKDPSNNDNSIDRNFLRNDILPRLENRWMSIDKRFSKVTRLALESSERSDNLAKIDLDSLGDTNRIDADGFSVLSQNRRRNLLRYILKRRGIERPSFKQMMDGIKILTNLTENKKNNHLEWPSIDIFYYDEKLFFIEKSENIEIKRKTRIFPDKILELGDNMGRLTLKTGNKGNIAPEIAELGLDVSFRKGGEKIKPIGRKYTHKLKNLFQEKKIYPWMRGKIPILEYKNELVCVGNLWVAEKFHKQNGYSLIWSEKPDIN